METLLSKIKSKVNELNELNYENMNILNFFNYEFQNLRNRNECEASSLITIYYFCINDGNDVTNIKIELDDNSDILFKYMSNIKNNCFIDNGIKFKFDAFKETVLGEDRYHKVLEGIFGLVLYNFCESDIYISYIDGYNSSINDKKSEKYRREFLHKLRKELHVDEIINAMNKKLDSLNKEYNRFQKNIYDEIDALQNVLIEIQHQMDKNQALFVSKKYIDRINDDEIKYEIYRVSNIYNISHLNDVYQENKKLKVNNIVYIKYIFKKAGKSIDNLNMDSIKLIMNYGDIDKIKDILDFIGQTDYPLIDVQSVNGIKAILNTDVKKLSYILNLIQTGIVNSDFVIKNQQILYDLDITEFIDGEFSILSNNHNMLLTYGFNLEDSLLNEILLYNKDDIYKNIQIFKQYNLDEKSTFTKEVISNPMFFKYVDSFIELGLYDFIKTNYNIINSKTDITIKRIYISKLIRLNTFDSNGKLLPSITDGEFIIHDDKLDDYIINESNSFIINPIYDELENNEITNNVIVNDDIKYFDEQFSLDNYTYKIGNSLISRIKTLNNYNNLKNKFPNYDISYLLECSLIYNSILNMDEIFNINDIINTCFMDLKQKKKEFK